MQFNGCNGYSSYDNISTSPFRFLDLPIEVRNQVYHLCFANVIEISLAAETEDSDSDDIFLREKLDDDPACVIVCRMFSKKVLEKRFGPFVNLLRVSTVIHDEATQMLYGSNTFVFRGGCSSMLILSSTIDLFSSA